MTKAIKAIQMTKAIKAIQMTKVTIKNRLAAQPTIEKLPILSFLISNFFIG
jgi:hypothetical protein